MKQVKRSALVPYSPDEMFDVINDVRSYPDFLPWCTGSTVLSESTTELVARLYLSRGALTQSFTTRNQLERPSLMSLELVEGPFTALSGQWHLVALGEDGCKVTMHMKFEFNSHIMNMTLGTIFNAAADQMVEAFCRRADALYGNRR